MSVLGAIGAGILGTFQAGIPQFAYGVYQDQRDYGFAQKQWDYQKALQKQIFEREDNAVQRRRLDLEAAGMNPNLAAGSAAGAGSVVGSNSKPSSHNLPSTDVLSSYLAYQQAKQQSVELDEMKEDLEQRRIQNFYNRVAQIYDSSNGSSSKLVSPAGHIYDPYEVKWDDSGYQAAVNENGHWVYLTPIESTPAWQQVKDTRNILKQNSEQSIIDTLSSKYDYENISVDRWIDRISKGVGAITDVGGLVTDISDAVTARQRAGAYDRSVDLKRQNYDETYTRTRRGYEKHRRYR